MQVNNIQTTVLDAEATQALMADAVILSRHAILGPKVFILPFGDIVKVFNPKSGVTRRHWRPKYLQFIENAQKLHALHINTVNIHHIYCLADRKAYAVRYTPLPGRDLRSLMAHNTDTMISQLLDFMVTLHDKGIYFRGLHLGNVLLCDAGGLGIIDMADMRFKRSALGLLYRVRNIAHMVHRPEDQALFQSYGMKKLLAQYCDIARITGLRRRLFMFLAACYGMK